MSYLLVCLLQLGIYLTSFYYMGTGEVSLGEFIIITLVLLGTIRIKLWLEAVIEVSDEEG